MVGVGEVGPCTLLLAKRAVPRKSPIRRFCVQAGACSAGAQQMECLPKTFQTLMTGHLKPTTISSSSLSVGVVPCGNLAACDNKRTMQRVDALQSADRSPLPRSCLRRTGTSDLFQTCFKHSQTRRCGSVLCSAVRHAAPHNSPIGPLRPAQACGALHIGHSTTTTTITHHHRLAHNHTMAVHHHTTGTVRS